MKRRAFAATLAAAAVAACSGRLVAGGYQVSHTNAEWLRILGPDRYGILRESGTEPAFSSPLNGETRPGAYFCAGCDLALFSSKTKYDAGEGWPSFWDVLPGATQTHNDDSFGMDRTEVRCRRCGGHLGHVFDDGPPPTHLRYCIDGLALRFVAGASA